MREYQKPELVDLKNFKAAGACTGGSSPVQDCANGELASYCINGTNPGPGGCNTGISLAGPCISGFSPV